MVRIGILGFVMLILFCTLNSVRGASNERFRDNIDRLRDQPITDYCMNVAEVWDDGIWAKSMGIAENVMNRADGEPDQYTMDQLPKDGIRYKGWDAQTEREKAWYMIHFHAGYKDGEAFIHDNPEVLVDMRDMSGVIPLPLRMQMKDARFKLCLHEGRPKEA